MKIICLVREKWTACVVVAVLMPSHAQAVTLEMQPTIGANEPIVVQYESAPGASDEEWIAIHDADDHHVVAWQYTDGGVGGELTFADGLNRPGDYQLRFYPVDTHQPSARFDFNVVAGASPLILPTDKVYQLDEPITVDLAGLPGNARDWIGVYKQGEASHRNFLFWQHTQGVVDGQVTLNRIPESAGEYKLRLFENNRYKLLAQSTLRVTPARKPRVHTGKQTYQVGEQVNLRAPYLPEGSRHWIGFYAADETDNRRYLAWKRVSRTGDGLAEIDANWPAGDYEARLYFHNTYNLEARTSFRITPGDVSTVTIALLGDLDWIEPSGQADTVPQPWPQNFISDASIRSTHELVSVTDVQTGEQIPITADGDAYIARIPPFTFASFYEVAYRDTIARPGWTPEWALTDRINGYTGLSPGYYFKPELHGDAYYNAEPAIASLGFTKYTRMAKSHTKYFSTMWNTDTIALPDGSNPYSEIEDSVRLFGETATDHALDLIAYYKDMGDIEARKKNPEWECKDPEGNLTDTRFVMMDFASGWKDVVLGQLLELAERGAKGIYFDFIHSPHWGCYGTRMESMFVAETGLQPPVRTAQGRHWSNHENWERYMQFQAAVLASAIGEWKEGLENLYPGFQFIVSSTYLSGLTSQIHATSLAEISDVVKVEFTHGRKPGLRHKVFENDLLDDGNLAKPSDTTLDLLAHLVPRDFSRSESFHTWATGFPSADQLRGFVVAAIAMGGVADIYIPEQYLRSDFDPENYSPYFDNQTPYSAMADAIEAGNRLSPAFSGKRPSRFAGVYFPEAVRNSYKLDYEAAWRNAIWPFVGAYEQFLSTGVPVAAVSDSTLRGVIDELQVLYLPVGEQLLPPETRALLDSFRGRGGTVLLRDPASRWGEVDGTEDAYVRLQQRIEAVADSAVFRVQRPAGSGEPRIFSFFYD